MTKVTRKTFAIVEFIAGHDGRGVLPSELVDALSINQATCIRLLKDLVELGYLEQISRQRGYTLGPMANWLARICPYKKELLEAATPLVDDCSMKAGQSVLLSIRRGARRYVLAHRNSNPRIHIDVSKPFTADFYYTATGRLLLAFAEPEERERLLDQLGMPSAKDWPEIKTREELGSALDKIRKDAFVSFTRQNDLFISAFPVWRNGVFEAALGMSVPCRELLDSERGRYVALLRDCAEAINAKLRLIANAG